MSAIQDATTRPQFDQRFPKNLRCRTRLQWRQSFSLTGLFQLSVFTSLILATTEASAALRNRYSFTADASDSIGAANGQLLGNATITSGAAVLNGSSAYVDLPNNLVSGYTAITIEAWLVNNGSGNWARIFDFGNNTGGEGNAGTGTQYMFLTPGPGAGVLRAAYTASGNGAEQQVNWNQQLATGTMKHVVLATDGVTGLGRLYVDGVLVGSNTAMTLTPAGIGPMNNVWIGRSQWNGDAFLNGSVTEFRIWDNALSGAEILANFQAGPDVVAAGGPVTITTQPLNQTVGELQSATFSVAYNGARPVALQWFRNGQPIAGANGDSYTLSSATLADSGAVFSVALTNTVTNTVFSALSGNATLNVLPDLIAPTLVNAVSVFPEAVLVIFSEPVRADTAANVANYSITGPGGILAINGASLGGGQTVVTLATAPQTLGSLYTLTVNGVRDLANAANLITPGSQTTFTALDYVGTNIGAPIISGTLTTVTGGYDLTAGGRGIGGNNDQFSFGYRLLSGDFDTQLRVALLPLVDAWSRAGLMARSSFATNAAFAASLSTPGPAGSFFQSRLSTGAVSAMAGQFPANHPDTWLRLRRAGNVFSGFASLDGVAWHYLGSETIAMPTTIPVGFAFTSGLTNTGGAVQFRNVTGGGGVITTNAALPFEPLGPSTRRTALVFSEIMYNPPAAWAGTNNLEFVELWNSGLVSEDLTGFQLKGDIDFNFPAGSSIASGQFLVIARDPAAAQGFYGVNCLGPYTNNLGNADGTLRLVNEVGGRILDLHYDNKAPWPVAADGTGHSLVLRRPSYGEDDARGWAASDIVGGSPGRAEHWSVEPARGVVINEFLANTDGALVDFIELFNTGGAPVDMSGFWLSDEANTNKFRIPNGTSIPARGFLVFDQNQLGFGLSSDGERLFLVNSNLTRVIDAVEFDAQAVGVSRGRVPDGASSVNGGIVSSFVELAGRTPGAANAAPLLRPIVINEIMYHPISGSNNDEYVELHNRSAGAVSLANWRLDGGIGFTFPSNAVITAGGHVVVAENVTNLLSKYPHLNATNCFGNFGGSLANGGERIALLMPEPNIRTNGGVITTNLIYVSVNEVDYRDGGRWGKWSDGGGSSLELTDPWSDNRFGASWADSDESLKAPWTSLDVTNILENGQTAGMISQGGYNGPPNRFEFYLHDDGEALVDNIEFRNNTGPNLVPNGDFANGTNGWTLGGTCRRSFAEGGVGIGGGTALHLVATDRGDAGPNKISTPFTGVLVTNAPNTGTFRAQVRWLRGSPHILFRTRGNWMEISRRLNLPPNLGTPGLPNSRLLLNAGPVIADVAHTPVLPAGGQSVVVTARMLDPDGVGAPAVSYRLDPATGFVSVPMNDAGTDGDAVAGDGIYSAILPGQSAGALVAFYVSATDLAASPGTSRFPSDAPARECLVRWGENAIGGSLGTYRLWVTASNVTHWTARERNANDPMDATFVYGGLRAVYNVRTLYSGSPFHAPNYNGPLGSFACDYEVNFSPDETFLGSEDFVLSAFDVPSGNFFFTEKTGQVDITGNWIARKLGQPFNTRRHIHVVVNGLRRGTIYDDAQQPNRDWLEQSFPDDSEGELRKIEDWFEFADDAQTQGITTATLNRVNRTGGGIDTKRYRYTWRPRATDNPDDWFSLTNLILAVNDTTHPNYVARVKGWMDVPNFLRPIVTHHICGDWDSYGYERGKNMYAYKPENSGWRLLMWDIELALGAGSRAATDGIYQILDPVLSALVTGTHEVNREYLAAYLDAVNGPLAPGAANALLDQRYASLLQNGVEMNSPQSIKNYITARRTYLISQIPAANFAINGTNFITAGTSNLVTLTGTAPVNVKEILVNGVSYPVTWTSTTAWTLRLPVSAGTNLLDFAAVTRLGGVISNRTMTVVFSGTPAEPEGNVVFSELMYQPLASGAEYVELFNNSTNVTFDLAGWRINGLNFTFGEGSFISPRSFLVVARDTVTHSGAYGFNPLPFAAYNGNLDADGETLTLLRPGALPGEEIVVDRVRYEPGAPWPAQAAGFGGAAQLIDPARDNSRAGNWSDSPEWRYITVTGTAVSSRLLVYMNGVGDAFIDDMVLVHGPVPESGPNLLRNGNFEEPLTNGWTIPTANQRVHISMTNIHSGAGSLHVLSTNPSLVVTAILVQEIIPALTNGQTYSLSFWLRPAPGSPGLITRMSAGTLSATNVTAPLIATPGAANPTFASLPPFPEVWLNEVQALNLGGITDGQGEREPWVELHNPGATPVPLDGLFLSDNYVNLTAWPFPSGATLNPGEFKLVFLDGEPGETTAGEWHSSFRLNSTSGSVALARLVGSAPQVVDYLNFTALAADGSYGDFGDGQPFFRQGFFYVTPGGTNNGAARPIQLFINEWMAANSGVIRDPADNDADDWFEIYNPNAVPVDLGGYFLTDTPTNRFLSQYQVPANGHYVIPPGGYVLVWADGEPQQNATNRADLHANFNLRAAGEGIGIFAPDGRLIDAIFFTNMVSNVSQGRSSDGSPGIITLATPSPRSANAPPAPVASIVVNGNNVGISFSTVAGRSYRVEFKDSLNVGRWTQLAPAQLAAGTSMVVADILTGGSQRFYRVVLIQ